MDAADVELIARETVYDGCFAMERLRLRHHRFDGGWTGPVVREIFLRGPAVAVLPYDPVNDEVVMIEQFRVGAYAAGRPPWVVEIVAGIVEPGETDTDVARRETAEEIGVPATDLERLFTYMPSPGALVETVTMFVGRVDAGAAPIAAGLADENEDIRVSRWPVPEALGLLREGRIDTAITLIGLQWLALNHADLRRRWNG